MSLCVSCSRSLPNYIFCISSDTLQVYVHRSKVSCAPSAPATTPPPSQDPVVPSPSPPTNLPIAYRKGTHTLTSHSNCHYISYDHLSHSLHAYTSSFLPYMFLTLNKKPFLYSNGGHQWRLRCLLHDNGTWELAGSSIKKVYCWLSLGLSCQILAEWYC